MANPGAGALRAGPVADLASDDLGVKNQVDAARLGIDLLF